MRKLLTCCALVALACSCRAPHLGSNHGKATRASFEAQAQRKSRAPAPMNARDATDAVEAQHADDESAPAPAPGIGLPAQ